MAALPSYVRVMRDDAGEQFDPGVVVSDMERGLQKMRVGNSRVAVHVQATLYFGSRADSISFEDWYFNTIKRIGFFDWKDPRSGTIRSVRFKGGAIGQLEPITSRFGQSKRTVTLEYLR